MHRNHVRDGAQDQQVDEGNVHHVPQREDAFASGVLGYPHRLAGQALAARRTSGSQPLRCAMLCGGLRNWQAQIP